MDDRGLPTLDDVARRAGVSAATVSRCLNTPDRVRPETRQRVEAAVNELGYTPHFGGRMLASNRTNTIGAIIPTMENAIFAAGIQAVQDQLSAHGVTLLVATSHYDPDRESVERTAEKHGGERRSDLEDRRGGLHLPPRHPPAAR